MSPRAKMAPVQRPRNRRGDLTQALFLRPSEIYELYGISPSKLHELCSDPNPAMRLPSKLIKAPGSVKGMRLIEQRALRAWLEKFDTSATNAA